jgi:hypothetical protein
VIFTKLLFCPVWTNNETLKQAILIRIFFIGFYLIKSNIVFFSLANYKRLLAILFEIDKLIIHLLTDKSKLSFTYHSILEPKAIPACLNISKTLMKYLSLPHIFRLPTVNSESNCLSIFKICPSAFGIGSPWGSSVGFPKKSSSLLISFSDFNVLIVLQYHAPHPRKI